VLGDGGNLYIYRRVWYVKNEKTLTKSFKLHLTMTKGVTVVLTILAVVIVGNLLFTSSVYLFQQQEIQDLSSRLNDAEQSYNNLSETMNATIFSSVVPTDTTISETQEQTPEPSPELTPEPTPELQYLTYENGDYRYSLEYLKNWTLDESRSSEITFTSPERRICNDLKTECYSLFSLFTIKVIPNPQPAELEAYFNKAVSDLQEEYSITTTTNTPTTYISGVKAYGLNYYTKDERGVPMRMVMQLYVLIDDKIYIITYSAPYSVEKDNMFDTYRWDALNMVQSFNVDRIYNPVE
jgi:hypothetical protein